MDDTNTRVTAGDVEAASDVTLPKRRRRSKAAIDFRMIVTKTDRRGNKREISSHSELFGNGYWEGTPTVAEITGDVLEAAWVGYRIAGLFALGFTIQECVEYVKGRAAIEYPSALERF